MESLLLFLVILTLPQSIVPEVLTEAQYQPVIAMVSGDSRIFSGERVRLSCSIPDKMSTWKHLWFRGKQLLGEYEEFSLWNAHHRESGKYRCQGIRQRAIGGPIHTTHSLPLEITVDGGWAILQVPNHPILDGDTLKLTCRVRRNPKLAEVFLYRDDMEIMRQSGPNPQDLFLPNITLNDQGLYSCRATWDHATHRSISAISVARQVTVLESLTEPVLEVVQKGPFIQPNMMKLICHVQYNVFAPAPPLHFYFYKDDERLSMASTDNAKVVTPTPGQYSCRAKVPMLGLERWSETKVFGNVPETHSRVSLQPREKRPLPPPRTPAPVLILHSAAQPTMAWLTPEGPTAPLNTDPTPKPVLYGKRTQTTSQAVPTDQTTNQVVPTDQTTSQVEPVEMSGDSANLSLS